MAALSIPELTGCTPNIYDKKNLWPCSFAGAELIQSGIAALQKGVFPYYKSPPTPGNTNYNMFVDYISEFPIYVLKEGSNLVHSSRIATFLESNYGVAKRGDIYKLNEECWWSKYYPGQEAYGGGWFTAETSHGGPDFGVDLHYRVMRDIPLLFIPNDYDDRVAEARMKKLMEDQSYNEYIDIDDPKNAGDVTSYRGSHIIQGPRNWKKKGYQSLRHVVVGERAGYYADGLAYVLSNLGFNGYISCDECEVFLSHGVMESSISYPHQIDLNKTYFNDENGEFNQEEYNTALKYITAHCFKQREPLKVTEKKTRAESYDVKWLSFKTFQTDK